MVDAASHFTALQLAASNLRNQFNVSMEYGWNKNIEVKLPTKDIYMIICGFWGVNIENDKEVLIRLILPQ
jgi:hypothetical protein